MRNIHHKLFHPQTSEAQIWVEKTGKNVGLMQADFSELCSWLLWSQFLKKSLFENINSSKEVENLLETLPLISALAQ